MLNSMVMLFFKLGLFPISFMTDMVLMPFRALLNGFSANFSQYSEDIYYFINNVLVKGVGFAREVFLNVTHYPRHLFNVLVSFYAFKFGLHYFILFVRWVINVYYIIRGSHTKGSAGVVEKG